MSNLPNLPEVLGDAISTGRVEGTRRIKAFIDGGVPPKDLRKFLEPISKMDTTLPSVFPDAEKVEESVCAAVKEGTRIGVIQVVYEVVNMLKIEHAIGDVKEYLAGILNGVDVF